MLLHQNLETERFILRAFTRKDMEEYFEILRDNEVQKYLGGAVPPFDREPHITNWLNNINGRLLKSKKVFTWCVEERETGKIAGRIDLGGFQKKTFAEIAYHFAKEFWNKGVATEVVNCITNFGMKQLKLYCIQAMVIAENIPSIRVLEKNNYIKEGTLCLYPFGKEFNNTVIMGIVSEENFKENFM